MCLFKESDVENICMQNLHFFSDFLTCVLRLWLPNVCFDWNFCVHKSHENSSSSLVLNCFCWHNLTCFFVESDLLLQYSQTWDWSSCLDIVCFWKPDLVKNCWLHLSHSYALEHASRYCFVPNTFAQVAHESTWKAPTMV